MIVFLAFYGVAEWRMNHPACPPRVEFHLEHRDNDIIADQYRATINSYLYIGVVFFMVR